MLGIWYVQCTALILEIEDEVIAFKKLLSDCKDKNPWKVIDTQEINNCSIDTMPWSYAVLFTR